MSNQLEGGLQYVEVNGEVRFIAPGFIPVPIKLILDNPKNIIQEQSSSNVPRFNIVITENE